MAGRQPERMVDDTSAALSKCWRPRRLLPRAPAIGRAKNRRSKMPRARGCEKAFRLPRIGNRMMNDVAEKLRTGELPAIACDITRQRPQSLASRDQYARLAQRRRTYGDC